MWRKIARNKPIGFKLAKVLKAVCANRFWEWLCFCILRLEIREKILRLYSSPTENSLDLAHRVITLHRLPNSHKFVRKGHHWTKKLPLKAFQRLEYGPIIRVLGGHSYGFTNMRRTCGWCSILLYTKHNRQRQLPYVMICCCYTSSITMP